MKWHESLAETIAVVASLIVFLLILTSPCWGLALIFWAAK